MDFPKNTKIKIDDTLTISVRPYLLNSDIEIIESQISQPTVKTRQDRKNIVETLVMRFCTDAKDFDTDELDITVLDMYRANGVIGKVMKALCYDSWETVEGFINIEMGNEMRDIKLLVVDLINSVNNVSSGKAEEVFKNSIKELEDAKAKLNETMHPNK